MINLVLPEPSMWMLRWGLFLGPLVLLVVVVHWRKPNYRQQVAGLFAFLYGVSGIFVTHLIAIQAGWWRYGWNALMLNGIPADIIIGGAILLGPVLYLTLPRANPILISVAIMIGLHSILFTSLSPLVSAGPNWIAGVVFVFATTHIPALYLARWTEKDVHLPLRAVLLALMYAGLSLGILPTLIMAAMGGEWALMTHTVVDWIGLFAGLSVSFILGLAAVQMLAIQGLGTAIPLDPTKRLVRTGIYAFVRNPMQLSAALSWLTLGSFLANVWVMSAAIMAWVFVEGMVRWHHRHDLQQRFPKDWADYRHDVPEWLPLWRPADRMVATLSLESGKWPDRIVGAILAKIGPVGIDICHDERDARYCNPADFTAYTGLPALCMALTHGNFVTALIGHTLLLPALPFQTLFRSAASA